MQGAGDAIGRPLPAATGLERYRRLEIEPTEPVHRRAAEELGLLDESQLAAELGISEDGELEGFGLGGDGGGNGDFGELADLPGPSEPGTE